MNLNWKVSISSKKPKITKQDREAQEAADEELIRKLRDEKNAKAINKPKSNYSETQQ